MSERVNKVAVIGSGSWGTATAGLLAERSREVYHAWNSVCQIGAYLPCSHVKDVGLSRSQIKFVKIALALVDLPVYNYGQRLYLFFADDERPRAINAVGTAYSASICQRSKPGAVRRSLRNEGIIGG